MVSVWAVQGWALATGQWGQLGAGDVCKCEACGETESAGSADPGFGKWSPQVLRGCLKLPWYLRHHSGFSVLGMWGPVRRGERELLLPLLVSPPFSSRPHPLFLSTLSFCVNFSLLWPALNLSQPSGSSEGNSDAVGKSCSIQAAFLLGGFVSQQLSRSLIHPLSMQQVSVQSQCSKDKAWRRRRLLPRKASCATCKILYV